MSCELFQITVDKKELQFGGQVLGETSKKTIMLVNEGALGTTFHINKITGELASTDLLTKAS